MEALAGSSNHKLSSQLFKQHKTEHLENVSDNPDGIIFEDYTENRSYPA